jgi:hypothetical protein
MKKLIGFYLLIGTFLTLLFSLSCTDNSKVYDQDFNLKKIAGQNSGIATISEGKGFNGQVLRVVPTGENATVTIWKTGDTGDWTKANYFVFEIFGNNDYSGVITLEFYKKTSRSSEKVVLQSGEVAETEKDAPWLTCLLGINPSLKTKVVFPLSYLDAQEIFIPRSPRQLKGTISGNRIDPADIITVNLKFGPFSDPYFTPAFEIASIGLNDSLPEPYEPVSSPVIDPLGQRTGKDWPGKIKNEEELVSLNLELGKSVSGSEFNSGFSRYGGWKAKQFKATGFFRTENDGRRWWLVDPEGYAFLSVGVDCMRSTSSGPVKGIEDLFEWLPERGDQRFAESVSGNEAGKNMDFYKSNLIRVFGSDWKSGGVK